MHRTKTERREFYESVVKYFNENKSTVRKTAEACDTSKSTVYNIVTKRLPNSTSADILKENKRERHIRGGEATKRKYRGE